MKRHPSKLYTEINSDNPPNIVGVDIPFNPPENPDYTFDNSQDNSDLRSIALDIYKRAKRISR